MKRIIVLTFVIFSLTLHGQSKLSIGLNLEPVTSKNIYQLNINPETEYLINLNEYDNWRFGYIIGASLEKVISQKCLISLDFEYKSIKDIYYNDLPTYYGQTPTYKSNIKLYTDLKFISVPIGLIYGITENKNISFAFHPKIKPEILLNENISDNQFSTDQSKINFLFNLGLRFGLNLLEDITFLVEPEYGITFNHINHIDFSVNQYAKQRNNYFGFIMGLRFEL